MNREQILELYTWRPGTCFKHPSKGVIDTTVVGVVHPRDDEEWEVRGCKECVVTMEAIRREEAARSGSEYAPGRLGEVPG